MYNLVTWSDSSMALKEWEVVFHDRKIIKFWSFVTGNVKSITKLDQIVRFLGFEIKSLNDSAFSDFELKEYKFE